MALTNREKQARWRKRHIRERRAAQRIASLLIRRWGHDDHIDELAKLLSSFLTREGNRDLRRALKRVDANKSATPTVKPRSV
jgi:hypothetical protein